MSNTLLNQINWEQTAAQRRHKGLLPPVGGLL